MMKPSRRFLAFAAVMLVLFPSSSESETKRKERALYAPPPGYPTLPDGRRPRGKGIFVLHVDQKKGVVTSVSIEKSTGVPILDREAVNTFKRWRFFPGRVPPRVTIPIAFNG